MVSIVIPTYTNAKGLVECIESVKKYTDMSQAEIIVVANGWSSITDVSSGTDYAWYVYFGGGSVGSSEKAFMDASVLPVRSII